MNRFIPVLLILGFVNCLAFQSEEPARLYPGTTKGSSTKAIYLCSIQVRLGEPYIMAPLTPTQVTETVEEKLSDAGFRCSDGGEYPRLAIDLSVSNEYGSAAVLSSYLSAFSFTLIPGYLGSLRHNMGISVELPAGKPHKEVRLNYTSNHVQFSWFPFVVGGMPTGYIQRKNVAVIGSMVDSMTKDLERLPDVSQEQRYANLVVLKNGKRYYNVRATESNGAVRVELRSGEKMEIPKPEVDSVKPWGNP
ncbi:MAG: hypothetical protein JNM27_08515 [Leptospirales bacterium]|nr:hypothetical protein [Leptospirales bacterium]